MEFITYIIALLAAGCVAGLIAGLFGVGGGVVMVPVLFTLFSLVGIPASHTMQIALGTSLATIAITAISSARAHHQRGAVNWQIFWRMTPALALGALLGAQIADQISSNALKIAFILGEFAIAFVMWRAANQAQHALRTQPALLKPPAVGIAGLGVGCISALGGIGGGTLNVPYLSKGGLAMQSAVGTAAAMGFPIALFGAAGLIFAGLGNASLTDTSYIGYLHWPAWLSLVIGAVIVAPQGAKLAHALPASTLKRYFAIFLVCMGIWMSIAEFVLDIR